MTSRLYQLKLLLQAAWLTLDTCSPPGSVKCWYGRGCHGVHTCKILGHGGSHQLPREKTFHMSHPICYCLETDLSSESALQEEPLKRAPGVLCPSPPTSPSLTCSMSFVHNNVPVSVTICFPARAPQEPADLTRGFLLNLGTHAHRFSRSTTAFLYLHGIF